MRGRTLILATALLLGTGTVCTAGDRGILNHCGHPSCCDSGCCDTCDRSDCGETCSRWSGGLLRRGNHGADCCETDCCASQNCLAKFFGWLCFRPPHCRHGDCKGHNPCCTPPLYTFFTCCEGYGCSSCGSCFSHGNGSSCTSCGR